jgi:hypothetical protein
MSRPNAPIPEPETNAVRYRQWIAPGETLVKYLLVPRDLTIEAVM